MRGKKNADGNVVYRGMHADVVTPKGRAMRGVATWDGDDRMVFKLYDTLGGAEFHMMTWTAERVK